MRESLATAVQINIVVNLFEELKRKMPLE
jgi:hypothetical protein